MLTQEIFILIWYRNAQLSQTIIISLLKSIMKLLLKYDYEFFVRDVYFT